MVGGLDLAHGPPVAGADPEFFKRGGAQINDWQDFGALPISCIDHIGSYQLQHNTG